MRRIYVLILAGVAALTGYAQSTIGSSRGQRAGFWRMERQDGRDWAVGPDGRSAKYLIRKSITIGMEL